eukprot:TRINITY_DN8211_c0_g2_i1.p1 TRINITY_DN8211_c0_g2~~TRINITY_DN8211_c0_g2_i1.p1  ORF type:complete len:422 (+),score=101.29 TRINITY_DN8211_c0_g2_i1:56-1321(+)
MGVDPAAAAASDDRCLSYAEAARSKDIAPGAVVDFLDPRLTRVGIEPKDGEADDDGFPRNLSNAVELLLKTKGNGPARLLQQCSRDFFQLLERRPKAGAVKTGRACVCWACGFCGLELEPAEAKAPRTCSRCGDAEQTNYVQAMLSHGVAVPWMEACAEVPLVGGEAQAPAALKVTSAGVEEAKEAQAEEKPQAQEAPAAGNSSEQPAAEGAAAAEKGSDEAALATADAGEPGAPVELAAIDERAMSVQVEPNGDEGEHANFPRNLYHAQELLLHVGRLETAARLQRCLAGYFALLEEGPQAGKTQMGQGYVCFDCGHCGLVADTERDGKKAEKACFCSNCGDDTHNNLVQLILPDGRRLPWLQRVAGAAGASAANTSGMSAAQAVAAGRRPPGALRVKPNEPCPCGSGKKAKKCCHVGGL